jgi:hypothetical protein
LEITEFQDLLKDEVGGGESHLRADFASPFNDAQGSELEVGICTQNLYQLSKPCPVDPNFLDFIPGQGDIPQTIGEVNTFGFDPEYRPAVRPIAQAGTGSREEHEYYEQGSKDMNTLTLDAEKDPGRQRYKRQYPQDHFTPAGDFFRAKFATCVHSGNIISSLGGNS